MTICFDGADPDDFEQGEVFAGLYYGDVLDDDAFVATGSIIDDGAGDPSKEA